MTKEQINIYRRITLGYILLVPICGTGSVLSIIRGDFGIAVAWFILSLLLASKANKRMDDFEIK